jgi:alpha-L-arabinofuranosidase
MNPMSARHNKAPEPAQHPPSERTRQSQATLVLRALCARVGRAVAQGLLGLLGGVCGIAQAAPGAPAVVAVTVQSDQPGAVIQPELYGQFAEHLGAGIYGGLWVGPDSPIPNTRGWRNDVVQALRALHVPVVRWPGGCFADEYHWRDGIGPRAQRPVRLNKLWGGVTEDNAVGTHEFFDLVEQIGAQAYVNGNVGTGSAQELADWMEYMVSDSRSALAEERRRNGRERPFALRYFALGNELWGCGGRMTPQMYASIYRWYSTFLRFPNRPLLIAAGGNDAQVDWTETIAHDVPGDVDLIGHHYYTFPSGKFHGKGAARGFDEAAWVETLAHTLALGQHLDANLAVLERADPKGRIGFAVDEWGTWYDDDPAHAGRGLLFQDNTQRDAVVAALNFHLFHAHAARLKMANIAQMVNVLQAMVLTDGARMVLTPTYHAFAMYVPFQGATVLPVQMGPVPEVAGGQARIPALSVTAARTTQGRVVLGLVNTDPHQSLSVQVRLATGAPSSLQGQQLVAPALDAVNTLEAPKTVQPRPLRVVRQGQTTTVVLPPASVQVLLAGG